MVDEASESVNNAANEVKKAVVGKSSGEKV